MKKALLLSSILFAGAGCSAQQNGVESIAAEAVSSRQNLVDSSWLSEKTFTYRSWDQGDIQVRIQLTLITAESYELDGVYYNNTTSKKAGPGLEYEVEVLYVQDGTGKTYSEDNSYFANPNADGTYTMFNCDSSRNCSSTKDVQKLTIANGEMTIENHDLYLLADPTTDPVLVFKDATKP